MRLTVLLLNSLVGGLAGAGPVYARTRDRKVRRDRLGHGHRHVIDARDGHHRQARASGRRKMNGTGTRERYALAFLLTLVVWAIGGAPGRAQKPAAFKDAAAVWRQVGEQARELDRVIKAKKLGQVHEVAFEIRDLVRTLPDRSAALPADRKKQLATHVKAIDRIAALLDKYGDAKNLAATQAQAQQLHRHLHAIERLYPAGTLGHGHR